MSKTHAERRSINKEGKLNTTGSLEDFCADKHSRKHVSTCLALLHTDRGLRHPYEIIHYYIILFKNFRKRTIDSYGEKSIFTFNRPKSNTTKD